MPVRTVDPLSIGVCERNVQEFETSAPRIEIVREVVHAQSMLPVQFEQFSKPGLQADEVTVASPDRLDFTVKNGAGAVA